MRSPREVRAALRSVLWVLAAVAPWGCSYDFDAFAPSGDGTADASPQDSGHDATAGPSDAGAGGTSDAGSDAASGYLCGATTVTSCAGCPGAPFECARTGQCVDSCKADCGGLLGDPVECMGCQDGGVVVGRCVPAGRPAACLADGVVRCPAPSSVDDCPGPRQVRRNGACYACGERNTGGESCKGGNQCDTTGSDAFECN